MSKIFISHSSVNNAQALAVAEWLKENGWDDYFLDVEPSAGLAPGERWQEALKQAAHHCEAVLVLISPAWSHSSWCLAEFLLAKQLGKPILGVLIEPAPLKTLPAELTAEWQLCDLTDGKDLRSFRVSYDSIVPETEVSLAEAGFARLKTGLKRAGLDPLSFKWPLPKDPDRAPYRGLKALEAQDAAVFFGREADIVRGLDALRTLREQGVDRMLVILGASGSGKSSFLRAGLWPRLVRDDLHFLPLPIIRPAHAVLNGHWTEPWHLITSAAFSPDGKRVLTDSKKGDNALIWDAASGMRIAGLGGHEREKGVWSATFSPDGMRVVTASSDKTARIWDVRWLTQLHGKELVAAVCREKIANASRLTAEDVRNAPILSGRIGEDVCSPPSLLTRAWNAATHFLPIGRSAVDGQ